jgi:hypothetical protein
MPRTMRRKRRLRGRPTMQITTTLQLGRQEQTIAVAAMVMARGTGYAWAGWVALVMRRIAIELMFDPWGQPGESAVVSECDVH